MHKDGLSVSEVLHNLCELVGDYSFEPERPIVTPQKVRVIEPVGFDDWFKPRET